MPLKSLRRRTRKYERRRRYPLSLHLMDKVAGRHPDFRRRAWFSAPFARSLGFLASPIPLLLVAGCAESPPRPFLLDLVEELSAATEVSSPALSLWEQETGAQWVRDASGSIPGRYDRWITDAFLGATPAEHDLMLLQQDRPIPYAPEDRGAEPPFWTLERPGWKWNPYNFRADFRVVESKTIEVPPIGGPARVRVAAPTDSGGGASPVMEIGIDGKRRERRTVTSATGEEFFMILDFPAQPSVLGFTMARDGARGKTGIGNLRILELSVTVPDRIALCTPPDLPDPAASLVFRHRPVSLAQTVGEDSDSLVLLEGADRAERQSLIMEDAAIEYETYPTILLPPPSRIVYPVHIPEGSFLEFAVAGIAMEEGRWGRGTVRWLFEPRRGKPLTLFERYFDAQKRPWERRWRRFRVELGPATARKGRLVLETRPEPPGRPSVSGRPPGRLPDGICIGGPHIMAPPLPDDPPPQPRPNVVIISVATLRADHVSCYGYKRQTTPNIDRVAREGVLFEEAYSTSSWTLPAHASLYSSLLPSSHGAVETGTGLGESSGLIGHWFRSLGYRRGAFMDGVYMQATFGFARGFSFCRDKNEGIANILPHAIRWWDSQPRGFPKLLFLHCYDVHSPYGSSDAYRSRYLSDLSYDRLPSVVGDLDIIEDEVHEGLFNLLPEDIQHLKALYDADIYHTDRELGKLFSHLRRTGDWDGTLVVILSDHGDEFMEHGRLNHGKSLYEETVRVPLILKLPGRRHSGTRVRELVSLVDVLPTLADLLERNGDEGWRGKSLAAAMATASMAGGGPVYAEHRRWFKEITPDYSLIVDTEAPEGGDGVEMYDRPADRAERTDISPDRAQWVRQRARELRRKREQLRALGGAPASVELDDETRTQLRRMGYLN